jgi:hypothetical protein
MPRTRYTVRLPPALDTAVQERVRRGTPFAVLIREALAAYLADRAPTPADSADTLREIQDEFTALRARVEILERALTAVPTPRRQDANSIADTAPTSADRRADRLPTGADTPGRRPRGHRPGLPRETLAAIAAERTRCEDLSLRAFAMWLYDKDIYRAQGDKPVDASTLRRWLVQARMQGLL